MRRHSDVGIEKENFEPRSTNVAGPEIDQMGDYDKSEAGATGVVG